VTAIMEFRILGPTELWSAGRRCDLGPAKVRSGLAILLLTPRTILPAQTLIDRLWDASPPAKARDTLSVYMARLRANLREAVGGQVRLAARASGYILDVDPGLVDLHRFRQLRREAGALVSSGEIGAAAVLFRQADRLWRGQALAGIQGDWIAGMRDSLEEERRAAISERIGCELELGRHTDLVGELRSLLAQYPLDETFVAHQMLALYGSGRPADALALYRDTRRRLVEEQGAEPSPPLADLHQRILRRDPGLALSQAGFPSGPVTSARPEITLLSATALTGAGADAALTEHAQTPAERRRALGRLLDSYIAAADHADRVLLPSRHREPVPVGSPPALLPALASPAEAEEWLEREWRNMLLAAQYAGQHEWQRQCADLVHALAGFIDIKGYWDEAVTAHTLALKACRELAEPIRIARAALELCVVNQRAGRHEETLALAEEAAAIYQSLGDRHGLADTMDQLGLTCQRSSRSREALAYFSEARALYAAIADNQGLAAALGHSAIACWHLGRHPDGVAQMNESLALYRQVGDRRGEAKALSNLGKMQLLSGLHRDALDSFHLSLGIFTEIGGAQNQAILYQNIGNVHRYKGRFDKGLEACRRALEIYRDIGDRPDEANLLNDIGAIYQSAECYDEALTHYQQASDCAAAIGCVAEEVTAMRGIADVCRGSGRYADALSGYHDALELARKIGDPYEEAKILEGIAEATLGSRKPYEARIVFRQAMDIYERLGLPEAQAARIRMEATAPDVGTGSGPPRSNGFS
jgi:DNA-binding SARP family transcriptional activator